MTKNIALGASLAIVLFLSVTAAQDKGKPPAAPVTPIGGVILWWGRAADIPEGFEACDGTIVSTKDAVLKGAKPNLQGKFVRGADDYRSFVPTEYAGGGSDTINVKGAVDDHKLKITAAQLPAHTHTIKDHAHDAAAHTHAVGGHSHGIAGHDHTISPASHGHSYDEVTVEDNTDLQVVTGTAGTAGVVLLESVKSVTVAPDGKTTGPQTITVAPRALTTDTKALKTDKNTDGLKTSATALTTDPTGAGAEIVLTHTGTGIFDNKPSYLDLVFLIRVK